MKFNKLKSTDAYGIRLIFSLVRLSPWRSLAITALLVLSGMLEGIGLASFLPLMGSIGFETGNDPLSRTMAYALKVLGFDDNLTLLLTFICAVLIVKGLIMMWARLSIAYAGVNFGTGLRLRLLDRTIHADWSYFSSEPIGNLANAITTDITRGSVAYSSCFTLIAQAIQVMIYLGIALTVSLIGTIGGVVGGAILFGSLQIFIRMARRGATEQQSSFHLLLKRLVDQLGSVKPIKAMRAEDQMVTFLRRDIFSIDRSLRLLSYSKTGLTTLNEPVLIVLVCLGLYATIVLMELPISATIALAILFYRSATRLSMLQSAYQNLVSSQSFLGASLERIETANARRENHSGIKIPSLSDCIDIQSIRFSHGDLPVLQDVSMHIKAPGLTAIVGPSGSGKTTLVDLIVGLHEADSGRILIDGNDIAEIDIRAWRKVIGYVPQDLSLYNDSIYANVTLNDPNISRQRVVEVLKEAGAWEFVERFPTTIDTPTGERGTQLSGGQRQRIALARALARNPKLLILDEPTTALDPVAEAKFCRTLANLSKKLTIMAISHQDAVVEVADNVYRMIDGGRATRETGALANNIHKTNNASAT